MWSQSEPVRCPVCKVLLGRRTLDETFEAHCTECRALFIWDSFKHKPRAITDSSLKGKCNCGTCGR